MKGAKFRLHRAGSLGQLEMEVVSNLLLRAGWEPPSLAFPLVRQALGAAIRAVEHGGDAEPFVEILRFCTRHKGAEQGLYQPILWVVLARLTEFLGRDGGKGYLWGLAYAALVDLSSPSFRVVDQPVAVIVATSATARLRVDDVRRSMQLVMKSLRKSFAGSASSLAALEPLLREWPLLLDTLEGDIECHILRALDLEFQLGRAVDGRTLAELRSAASEMAQICRGSLSSSQAERPCWRLWGSWTSPPTGRRSEP